ncbi:MAG: arylsulfatase [Verrucomicrobiales bacterium]|nr:arylsulfatase [Verrucomicrobiales bacterium]
MKAPLAIFVGCVVVLGGLLANAKDAPRPNFVFFLVDDLGWKDLSCYGSEYHESPNIDAFASTAMRFTSGYAAASICSPTRASIVTGRHPVRVNVTDWIPGMKVEPKKNVRFLHLDDRDNLALEEVTIAEKLKESGYATFFAGKWHLGDEGFYPEDQGFDINIGGHDRGSPPGGYYAPWKNPRLEAKKDGEYLTERLTEESISFIQNRKDEEDPFLLYLSYYNVHTPIQAYEKRIDHFVEKAEKMFPDEAPEPMKEHDGVTRMRQDDPKFASMVAAVDDSVGAVLAALKEAKLDENTVVIFFSDNGGLSTRSKGLGSTCNLPLRAGKGWLYEGGIREATMVRVPGMTEPGSVSDELVFSTDFYPTMLELAGIDPDPEVALDGTSLVPVLKGGNWEENRTLYWHYPHYHGSAWKPGAAIRDGDWKLIEFWEWDEVELYNLADDIGERNDLSAANSEKVAELRAKLAKWQKEIGAKMPKPNPAFDPSGH